jgi:RNA polymerase sigma factor (sigma-70 family)
VVTDDPDRGAHLDSAALTDYEAAFGRLYRRAYDVAYKLLGYRSEAEDVAQEAMARAYLHWPKIHSYAEPWVVRVAANQAIGSWRKLRRLTHLTTDPDDEEHAFGVVGRSIGGGAVSSPDVGQHLELRRALGLLSKRQREVVVLRHIGGFSERETAAVIGCSTGSVKQHATRGLAALRAELLDTGEADGEGARDV